MDMTKSQLVEKTKELDLANRRIVQQKNERSCLVRELDTAHVQINQQKVQLESSKNMMTKQEDLLNIIKDKLMCPVCLDIPRHGPVFLCHNGHLVCQKCKRDSCPMCRTAMGPAPGKSLLASTILDNIDHKCKFDECKELFAKETIEKHEMSCCHRTVTCPYPRCLATVSLSELVGHILNSSRCSYDQQVTRIHGEWISFDISMGNFSMDEAVCWKLSIYNYGGENFVVFPSISGGYFFFVVAMLALEVKCSKFKFEMIVHGEGMKPLDSEVNLKYQGNPWEVNLKYQGNPLSIDLKEEELKLFGTTQQFMAKLVETSSDKKSFGLSFKMSKQ